MYQDEAGFGRISKMSSFGDPKGIRPSNTEWTNKFLRQVSQAYPDDYMLLVMDNAIWHKSSTLEIPSNIDQRSAFDTIDMIADKIDVLLS